MSSRGSHSVRNLARDFESKFLPPSTVPQGFFLKSTTTPVLKQKPNACSLQQSVDRFEKIKNLEDVPNEENTKLNNDKKLSNLSNKISPREPDGSINIYVNDDLDVRNDRTWTSLREDGLENERNGMLPIPPSRAVKRNNNLAYSTLADKKLNSGHSDKVSGKGKLPLVELKQQLCEENISNEPANVEGEKISDVLSLSQSIKLNQDKIQLADEASLHTPKNIPDCAEISPNVDPRISHRTENRDCGKEHIFTISRTSIDKIMTPEEATEEPVKVDSHYLMTILQHCQGGMDKRTPQKSNHLPSTANMVTCDKDRNIDDTSKVISRVSRYIGQGTRFAKFVRNKINIRQLRYINCLNRAQSIISTLTVHQKKYIRALKRIPIIKKVVLRSIIQIRRSLWWSVADLLLSMFASTYPTVPRCNSAASLAILFQSSKIQSNQPKDFFVGFAIVIFLSLGVITSWLLSDSLPTPLDPNADEFAYILFEESSMLRISTWYAVMIGIFFKLGTLYSLMGEARRSSVWKKVYVFFPPITSKVPQNINGVLQSRVVAVMGLECISSLLILALALLVQFKLNWSPHFTSPSPFLPLKTIMVAKSISGIALVLGILHNTNVFEALAKYGCLQPCFDWYLRRRNHSDQQRGAPIVLVTSSFLRFNGCLKLINFCIGIFMWVSLLWAHRLGGGTKPKDVTIILGLLTLLLILTDILGITLWVTVICYALTPEYCNDDVMRVFSTSLDMYDSPRSIEINENESEWNNGSWNTNLSSRHPGQDLCHPVPSNQVMLETERRPNIKAPLTPDNANLMKGITFQCSPSQFASCWQILPGEKTIIFHGTTKEPTRNECHSYFESRRFYIVASGFVDGGMMKIYAVAQRMGAQCLCKLIFDPNKQILHLKVKADDPSLVPIFVDYLQPRALFGGD